MTWSCLTGCCTIVWLIIPLLSLHALPNFSQLHLLSMLNMSIQQIKKIEIWCAQKLSNFEGVRGIELGDDFRDMEKLDARIHRIEQRFSINTSPPMLKITSDSLVYRVRRLDHRQSNYLRRLAVHYYPVTESSPEELLRIILSRLIDKPLDWIGEEEEISRLGALSQQLCHVAGQRNIRAPDELETFSQLHAFAVELSLDIESQKNHVPPPPQFISVGPGPGPGPRSRRPGKACCGCCSCICHRDKPILSKRSKWWRTPQWLKNLWCFKTKSDDSSSTSTLADGED